MTPTEIMTQANKLSLPQWLAIKESTTVTWAADFITELATNQYHSGDCTNEIHACNLCTLETILNNYYKYFKNDIKQSSKG